MSGITAQGHLRVPRQAHAFKGPAVVRFLKHRQGHSGGKVLIIWAGAPIPRDQAIQACLATGAAGQLCLAQVPGYAPDLTPDEGVWNHLQKVELRNVSWHDQDERRHELRVAIARLRRRPDLICGFIKQYGY